MHSNDRIIHLQLDYVVFLLQLPPRVLTLGQTAFPITEGGVGRENTIVFVTSPHTLLGTGVECEVCQGGAGGPWPGSGVQEGAGG